ncbi:hypothetical protein [Microscilla marina]|uniref:Lipoprotein, putative n=1 Tax=Microscilla marina ATCC 23134 TaxID=313606 RepID=A1ZUZ4_MICM2|nr:hypothetical protein [Microscilla marina]EAY25772.1 lipoprotein, putative [Microscilla marina ATCC 23134]
MNIQKSIIKYFLVVAVVAGGWGCTSTTNLQHANYEDDDVYFSRKDREKAKLAKKAEVKTTPKVVNNSTGMDVNPTYGVTTQTKPQTNINPEYVENHNGNSTITNNSNNYTENEYYTEYRASRVQVPRANYDSWGNANNGVFYDPHLDHSSPFYDPYSVQSAVVPFSVRVGWGRGWRYRRWYNRNGWYNPYFRNDFWYRRNAWNYGGGWGYYNTNPWCPPNYINRPIYNTTRVVSRPQIINRGPRRNGAGRRGNVILTNTNTTKRQKQSNLNNSGGRDVNKRSQTAGRRYKRTTGNNKRVNTNTTGTNTRRSTTRTRTRRSTPNSNRSRRGSSFNRKRSTPSFNRRSNTNRRSTFSRPSTRTRTRTTSRPSRKSSPKRSSGSSKRRKR